MKIETIINEVSSSYDRKMCLYGYHKDLFVNIPKEYELIFNSGDPEYPVMIKQKNYIPTYYGYAIY